MNCLTVACVVAGSAAIIKEITSNIGMLRVVK
jgi:NADH:ubiquinone oxidoreductase subunit E